MKRLPTLRRLLPLTLLVVTGLVMACSSSGPGPSDSPVQLPIVVVEDSAPAQQLPFPSIPIPPDLDLYSLTESLRVKSGKPIPRQATVASPAQEVGDRQPFWIVDLDSRKVFQVMATLRHVSPQLYMYVADGQRVSDDDLIRSAQEFENVIYPGLASRFGQVLTAEDADNSRLTVLHASIPAVAGYYNPSDEYPTAVNPFSNQRRMIYINLGAVKPATVEYYSLLAHELQHVVHSTADPTEEVWINEGLSTIAEETEGFRVVWPEYFRGEPDIQLTGWGLHPSESRSHYGAAYLFLTYLQQHYGGGDPEHAMRALVSEPADGVQGINAYLQDQGYDVDFDQVFKDWVVANYLDDSADGKYSYRDREFRLSSTEKITDYKSVSSRVHQYAADYVEVALEKGGARIIFQGFPLARFLPNEAHSGRRQWWSNRGDAIDSTLTREVDLSQVQRATLTFWVWYDIEDGFDYAYVEASVDGGLTWDILPGRNSSAESPLGNSFGFAYTGISGGEGTPRWIPESADLSDYARKVVLLRFQYVTDMAVNMAGFAIDDISIPEIGFFDDAEHEMGWEAQGFIRTDNLIPQRFFVQAMQFGDEIQVMNLPLTPEQRGEFIVNGFGDEVKKVVLVIAGATPVTSEVATYQIFVEPLAGD